MIVIEYNIFSNVRFGRIVSNNVQAGYWGHDFWRHRQEKHQ